VYLKKNGRNYLNVNEETITIESKGNLVKMDNKLSLLQQHPLDFKKYFC
jgi:hypothetical protein